MRLSSCSAPPSNPANNHTRLSTAAVNRVASLSLSSAPVAQQRRQPTPATGWRGVDHQQHTNQQSRQHVLPCVLRIVCATMAPERSSTSSSSSDDAGAMPPTSLNTASELVAALQSLASAAAPRQQQQQQQQQRQQQEEIGLQLLAACTSDSQLASLSAPQAAAVLHCAVVLQLRPPQPQVLLQSLMKVLAAGSAPAVGGPQSLSAAGLLQVFEGAAWLINQPQQQQPSQLLPTPPSEQQPQQQQQSGHNAVQPSATAAAAAQSASRPLSPQQQHAMLEAKRQQLLQLQQQQQGSQQAPQQHQQEQRHPGAAGKTLADILQQWCQQTAGRGLQQHAGDTALSPQQLVRLLQLLVELQVPLSAVCLQQVLQFAGLGRWQQQQLGRRCEAWASAADAAQVLASLADAIVSSSSSWQSQMLHVVAPAVDHLLLLASGLLGSAAMPAAHAEEGSVSAAGVAAARRQKRQQPAHQHHQNQQQMWPLAAALAAVSKLQTVNSGSSSSGSSGGGGHMQLVSSAVLRLVMDVLLAAVVPLSRQQERQQLQSQQLQQPLPINALSCAEIVMISSAASAVFKQQQQQQQQQHSADTSQGSSTTSSSTIASTNPPSSDGSSGSSGTPSMVCDSRVVKPLRFQLWLQHFTACALHPTGRLRYASAADLTGVLTVLGQHGAHMPPWWLAAAEQQLAGLLQQLCCVEGQEEEATASHVAAAVDRGAGVGTAVGDRLQAATALLQAWVKLLQLQPRRRQANSGSGSGGNDEVAGPPTSTSLTESKPASTAADTASADAGSVQAAASSSDTGNSSNNSSSSPARYRPYFLRSSWFMRSTCAVLQPVLGRMDASSLGSTSLSVAVLGLPREQQQEWLSWLMPAVAAAAQRAEGASASGLDEAAAAAATSGQEASSSVSMDDAAAAVAAGANAPGGQRLPGAAVVSILQSLVLLHDRPPQPLLQRLLLLLRRDMVLERGPVLVQLLVVLAQLRYRPGAEWLRAVLLRLQGKLRMLSFDQLTQLCWCLTLLGVQPPQPWQDDFMDAAAAHIIHERQRQQRWDAWHRNQQQHQRAADGGADADAVVAVGDAASPNAPPPRGHPEVHPWQLQVMHWAVLQCWQYRSSYRHGKLQWRAVRELNRAVWRQPMVAQLQRLQAQLRSLAEVSQQQQQQQEEEVGRQSSGGRGRGKQQGEVQQRLQWRVHADGAGGAARLQRRVTGLQVLLAARKARGQSLQQRSGTKQRQQVSQQHQAQQQVNTLAGSRLSQQNPTPRSSTSSRLYRTRGPLRGPARWVDVALWPKQWRLLPLSAMQPQHQHGEQRQSGSGSGVQRAVQ